MTCWGETTTGVVDACGDSVEMVVVVVVVGVVFICVGDVVVVVVMSS